MEVVKGRVGKVTPYRKNEWPLIAIFRSVEKEIPDWALNNLKGHSAQSCNPTLGHPAKINKCYSWLQMNGWVQASAEIFSLTCMSSYSIFISGFYTWKSFDVKCNAFNKMTSFFLITLLTIEGHGEERELLLCQQGRWWWEVGREKKRNVLCSKDIEIGK